MRPREPAAPMLQSQSPAVQGAERAAAKPVGKVKSRPGHSLLTWLKAVSAGGFVGLAFASGFVLSGLLGLPASSELFVGLGCMFALLASFLVLIARALVELRALVEASRFEFEMLNGQVIALQGEAIMLREIAKAGPPSADKRPVISGGVKFGTLSGRPCAVLGNGNMIVSTLVGYRKFNTQQDAEAFVGVAGLSLAD